eukprot:4710587-Amphidinium_carterae.1
MLRLGACSAIWTCCQQAGYYACVERYSMQMSHLALGPKFQRSVFLSPKVEAQLHFRSSQNCPEKKETTTNTIKTKRKAKSSKSI